MYPVYLEGKIKVLKETASLRTESNAFFKAVASKAINLPESYDRQMDLQYFSAVFVSSGCNLNNAYFLPSELLKAEGTVINKALDVEHSENQIIGHIYDRKFIDAQGNVISKNELSALDSDELNKKTIHIAVAGIVYKDRFPEIAKEINEGKWKVSMECYYPHYDIKVGDVIINSQEAEALGLKDESMLGKTLKVNRAGVAIASGELARVLREITFSGCGIVKNPANPPSIITEVAGISIDNNVTYDLIDEAELKYNDTVGICVHYKKEVYPEGLKTQETVVLQRDWCTLFGDSCTSRTRDTTDPMCLKRMAKELIISEVSRFDCLKDRDNSFDRHTKLIKNLINKI